MRTHNPIKKVIAAFFFALLLQAWELCAHGATLVDVRAGAHNGYERLVLELSAPARFKVRKDGSTIKINIFGLKPVSRPSGISSALFNITGFDQGKEASIVTVEMKDGASFKGSAGKDPFRIIMDFYPPSPLRRAVASRIEGARRAAFTRAAVKARPVKEKEATPPDVKYLAFNEGWRWAYRKRAVEEMKKESDYEADRDSMFKSALGLKGETRDELMEEASSLASSLREEGRDKDASTLELITAFHEDGEDPVGLEVALGGAPPSRITALGSFMLASYYESIGFYPEAAGLYARAALAGKGTDLGAPILARRSRLSFLEGKYDEAKKWSDEAASAGSEDWQWPANIYLIRGEYDRAWSLFSNTGGGRAALDPISRMGVGDLLMIRGEIKEAGSVYEELRSGYVKNEFLATFFIIKAGDLLAAEGRRDDAAAVYTKIIGKTQAGEVRAMAQLALADLLARTGSGDDLLKAQVLYGEVSSGGYIGSDMAAMSLIGTRLSTSEYEEGVADAERFLAGRHTSPLRGDVREVKAQLVYRWMGLLYSQKDYLKLARLYMNHGGTVPPGKKAEVALLAGKAFLELGLYPDAASSLETALKYSKNGTAEEALIAMAKVYNGQGDGAAMARTLKTFMARYPKSAYANEARALLARAAYARGEHPVEDAGSDDPELLFRKGSYLAGAKKYKEASAAFTRASALYEKGGDVPGAARARIGAGDAEFASMRYKEAAGLYRTALAGLKAEKGKDKSWALYRLVQCYTKLNDARQKEAYEELRAQNDELGGMAAPILAPGPKIQ